MKPTTHRGARRRGFALIITIVLVAFLVLILVGLATFTRVETQVASNSRELAKARQNALFALNVATGDLQRTAGPDRRVTATAAEEQVKVRVEGGPGWARVVAEMAVRARAAGGCWGLWCLLVLSPYYRMPLCRLQPLVTG